MNIILTGYRASGKTTIGKILAKKLKRPFLDIDNLIEQQEQKTIRQIFTKDGWQKFRQLERTKIKELSKIANNAIIAIGGGALMDDENLIITKNAKVILLHAPLKILARRIASDQHRPPLSDNQSSLAEITKIWDQRRERYRQLADLTVNTGAPDPQKAVEKIVEYIKKISNYSNF
ncbi:MAG: shikimate kinase [Candidatus Jacksonbacteria bacterium]